MVRDVRAGKLDAVVTYKIDRVSRTLKDFYKFWEILKAHDVTFVSATQHFDTSDSTGMLMLNILLSFAQFERELTRERTMSKMAGRAEKGLWNGGNVPLGYDYRQADPDAHTQRGRGAHGAVLLPAPHRDTLTLHGRQRGQRPRLPHHGTGRHKARWRAA
jgi:DNA invertase Pin-like site-specific DNA recombinase